MNTFDIVLSQTSFKVLQECDYKFKYKYIDRIFIGDYDKENREYNDSLKYGLDFHMEAARFFQNIQTSNNSVKEKLGKIKDFYDRNGFEIYNEHRITSFYNGRMITADLDMVAIGKIDGKYKVHIWDWKTDMTVPKHENLDKRMQTNLYMLLMYESLKNLEGIDFDSISMRYFYPLADSDPVVIKYSKSRYNMTLRKIDHMLEKINRMILLGDSYDYVFNNSSCKFCEYRKMCVNGNTL